MKNAIMGFLKSNIKWIIGIFIIIVLLIFLASSSYVLKLIDSSNSNHSSMFGGLNFGSKENNMNAHVESEISTQVSAGNIVSKGNGDYKFNINLDDKVNELYDEFSKTEEGRRKLNYITGTEAEKKELLKDMIRAELITQYPDLRTVSNMNTKVDSDEVQGVIRFKRVLSEPTIRKVASIKKSEDTSIELNGGIVCWGDEFTLGDAENSSNSYPAVLANNLQKNVYNLGFAGVTSQEIALLAGVDKYTLVTTNEDDVTIGKELGAEITISVALKKDGNVVSQNPFKTFNGSDDKKKLECTINGVDGELTYKEDSGTYVFKRKTEGEEIKVSKDSTISLKTQAGYKSAFPIIWIGNGNSYINYTNTGLVKNIAEDCWSLINMSADPDNYIVIIPTHYRDSNGELKKYESNEYDAIKKVFMEEAGFNTNQVLDLRDKINDGSEYNVIVDEIEKCMEKNNIKTKISGEYNQNVSNSEIIKLSNEYLPSDGTAITLEYIPLGNSLEPAPGTLMWLINNNDVEIQKAALQYFSIDASGNLIVANWNKVTTIVENFTDSDGNRDGYVYDDGYPTTDIQYTIVPSKVNYKDSISQYTMPFDYLWTWLVMGDDTEFVRKLTDLTLNSSIEATLYDELTVVDNDVVDELTNGYRTHYKEVSERYEVTEDVTGPDMQAPISIGRSTKEWDNVRYEDKKNHTKVITETNKIRYRLTYADVWNLTYKVDGVERLEYKGEEGKDSVSFEDNTTTGDSSNIEINDLYQKNVNDVTTYPVDWKESGDKRGPTSRSEDWPKGYVIISTEEQDYTLVKDHVITTIIIKSGYKYSSGTTSVKEKTDKNYTAQEMESGNFSDPNFVKYYIYSTGVRNNISSISSWLFEALENNSRTEGLVDITKYMLYKATDNDYGVTSIDFSAYNEKDFKDVSDITINDGGNSFNGGDGTGTGGDGNLSGDSGSHYWGVYKRGDKEYKCYYQNSYSGSMHNAGCVATAAAICHSGYGSTKTPMDFWNGSGATGCGITKISRSKSEIISYLNQNVPVVIYNSFPGGEFYGSAGGHAIVLVDINANGEAYVINPWHGSKWNGWYSLDYILSFSPGKNAPNTMGSSGVGVVLN